MTTHIALPSAAQAQLETALLLYRKAIGDLECAIQSEAWGSILTLQGSRDLQAHTIAAIVNNHTPSTDSSVGQGRHGHVYVDEFFSRAGEGVPA